MHINIAFVFGDKNENIIMILKLAFIDSLLVRKSSHATSEIPTQESNC